MSSYQHPILVLYGPNCSEFHTLIMFFHLTPVYTVFLPSIHHAWHCLGTQTQAGTVETNFVSSLCLAPYSAMLCYRIRISVVSWLTPQKSMMRALFLRESQLDPTTEYRKVEFRRNTVALEPLSLPLSWSCQGRLRIGKLRRGKN